MKTRSNMPLFVVETDNVKALSNSQIDLLRCGDYLVKKDASGEHAYKVTFKSDTGMCITYMDAYCVETQSYDKVDGNWVYNSEDKTIIAEPQLENIVDADGHKRFIEGDGTPMTSAGFTASYCKWSLSGSHLMLVLAGSFESGANVPSTGFANYVLPQWVYDKIYPVFGSRIEVQQVRLFNEDWSSELSQPTLVLSMNDGTHSLFLANVESAFTTIKERSFRVQFDLLIDNE